jgi:hypothetical protein
MAMIGTEPKNAAYKRIIAAAVAAALFAGLSPMPPAARAASNFVDTVGHWADDEIREAVDFGYINGYTDGRFWPDAAIKRSEFVKVVNSAMGYTELGNIAFGDVAAGEWYYDEVRKAAAAGYISGYGNGEWFAPNNPITREEVAMALFRVSPGSSSSKAPKGLKDASDIGDWALEAVSSAYAKGYLAGYPDGNFYPKRNLTRAETVKVINKVVGIDQDSKAITDISLSDITDTTAVAHFTSRKDGALYWAVIENDAPMPAAAQLSQGKDGAGAAVPQKANVKVTAYDEAMVNISGLSPAKSYRLLGVLKAKDGKFSNVRALGFSTPPQSSMGENWINTFSVGTVTQDSMILTVRSQESGMFYWVAVEEGASGAPSHANLTSGLDADGASAANAGSLQLAKNSTQSIEVTGLKPGASYYIYGFVSKAEESFSTVKTGSFRTIGVGTPAISSLTAGFNDGGMMEISFKANDAGKFYWIAVEESGAAFPPTPGRVKEGRANSSQALADKGVFEVTRSAVNKGALVVTKPALSAADPLKPNVKYRVYACLENGSNTLSSVVASGLFEKSTIALGLTNLYLSAGSQGVSGFAFSADQYDYTGLEVPNGTNVLAIRPVAANSADIMIDGRVASNNANFNYAMPSPAGTPATIVIAVSEVGKETKTYRIGVKENVPDVRSVYVAGSAPITPVSDAGGNYEVTVPASFLEVNMSVTFTAEMAGTLIAPDGTRIAVKSDERKKVALAPQPAAESVIKMEIRGPSARGDVRTYTLTVRRVDDDTPSPATPPALAGS